jgi:hypothetical protein
MRATQLPDEVRSVRFKTSSHGNSGVQLEGILRAGDDALEIEFVQISQWTHKPKHRGGLEAWIRSLSTGEELTPDTRKICIPFEHLDYLEARNWFFFVSIRLSTDQLSLFSTIPTHEMGQLKLRTRWSDRQRGLRFVAHANLRLAEWRMRQAEAEGGGSARDARFKVL